MKQRIGEILEPEPKSDFLSQGNFLEASSLYWVWEHLVCLSESSHTDLSKSCKNKKPDLLSVLIVGKDSKPLLIEEVFRVRLS